MFKLKLTKCMQYVSIKSYRLYYYIILIGLNKFYSKPEKLYYYFIK